MIKTLILGFLLISVFKLCSFVFHLCRSACYVPLTERIKHKFGFFDCDDDNDKKIEEELNSLCVEMKICDIINQFDEEEKKKCLRMLQSMVDKEG